MQKLFITTRNQSSIDFVSCIINTIRLLKEKTRKNSKDVNTCTCIMYIPVYVPAWNKKRKQIIVYNIIDIKQCVECDKEKEEILRLEL